MEELQMWGDKDQLESEEGGSLSKHGIYWMGLQGVSLKSWQ